MHFPDPHNLKPLYLTLRRLSVMQAWARAHPASHRQLMVVVASGLVLGEGTASIVSALLRALVLPRSS